jgi:hypothetical protein
MECVGAGEPDVVAEADDAGLASASRDGRGVRVEVWWNGGSGRAPGLSGSQRFPAPPVTASRDCARSRAR